MTMLIEKEVEVNLNKVKEFMIENKLSEYGLSKVMGVSYSYVYRVMRGKRAARQSFVNGLLRAGMRPKDIFLVFSLPKGNKNNSAAVNN